MIIMDTPPLPQALLADLDCGRRPLAADEKLRLGRLLDAVENPLPELYDLREIQLANQLWTSEYVQFYLGEESADHQPGTIDPTLACIIGDAERDLPIALDYRVLPPRVIYLNGRCWIELAPNYESLVAAISCPDT